MEILPLGRFGLVVLLLAVSVYQITSNLDVTYKRNINQLEIDNAVDFLRLPIWSAAFVGCHKPHSEVSCKEVVKAATILQKYAKSVKRGNVKIDVQSHSFPEILSMIYTGFCIGLALGKTVWVNKSTVPFDLPSTIRDLRGQPTGVEVPMDGEFCCLRDYRNLLIATNGWPQIVYTNHRIGSSLQSSFGVHAAYFIGNYLFGRREGGYSASYAEAVESYITPNATEYQHALYRQDVLHKCGVKYPIALYTNSILEAREQFPEFSHYKKYYNESDMDNALEAFYEMIHVKKFTYTFGSTLGYWVTALRGNGGRYFNTLDNVCTNLSISQAGSLWHTFNEQRDGLRYLRHGCQNSMELQFFMEHLLW